MHGIMHDHHVVPRSCGGTRTVPLCEPCHGKVHGTNMMCRALTVAALRVKKSRGEKLGGHAPYGWRGEHGMLVPDQSEQAVIRLVRELRARNTTLAGIAEALEARGLRTRIGWPHNVRSVSTVLAARVAAD